MLDTIIIGSGPAGLTAAIYAQRAELSSVVLEKDYMGSGQIAVSEQVDNYPGLPAISGYDLGEAFREHAVSLGAQVKEGEAINVSPAQGGYKITLKSGEILEAKTVIVTAGTSYRHLGIKGEDKRGISFCAVCDGAFYKDKTVAVIGGGDTALGDAVYLSKIAKKVYVIHRRDEFRANKSLQTRVKSVENIEPLYSAVPEEFLGGDMVNAIKLKQDGNEKTLDVDGVFIAIGSVPNTDILNGLCELEGGYIKAGEDCKTSAAGIFAAGDVRTKPLRQVVTAAADGAVAAEAAASYING